MLGKQLICICIVCVILSLNCFSVVLAQEVTANEEETTNEVAEDGVMVMHSVGDLANKKEEVDQKLEESTSKLEIVQEELSATLLEIATLQVSIDAYTEEVKQYRERLVILQNDIKIAEADLAKAEEECNRQDELLKTRLVTIYEAGETRYLDFLLTSKNLMEFISNYYLILQMNEFDNQLLDKLEEQRNQVQAKKNQLDRQKIDLKDVKAKAEQNETLLTNTQALQELKKASLTEEEQKIQKEIDEYREEQYILEQQIQLAIANSVIDLQFYGGTFIWPVAKAGTYITSYYGTRVHPILGVVKQHAGLDIGGAGYGAPVVAAADGVVSFAGVMSGYGNCVMVNHGDGVTTLYGHGQKILTEVGAEVKQGDLIMEVGSTGRSTGPHLHFEVRINGITTNPLTYIKTGTTESE